MITDTQKKKKNRPGSGSAGIYDLAGGEGEEVPEVNDVLKEIDAAIEKSELLSDQLRPAERYGCGCGG
jgi:hypothetical protein